jgi:hypothetical protein
MLQSQSGILYIRAGLAPLARQMRASKGWLNFFRERVVFEEIMAPHFQGARPFWRSRPPAGMAPANKSGALGRLVSELPGAVISKHPSHAFAGHGPRVVEILRKHTADTDCFFPVREMAHTIDFSMLLVGCVEESPGFSTVHAAQFELGLSQRHLIRYLMRWDTDASGSRQSKVASEAPGCSSSFDKFYAAYQQNRNLVSGDWQGVSWIFIPSAKRALETELSILEKRPRFVNCGRWMCPTCSFRIYW